MQRNQRSKAMPYENYFMAVFGILVIALFVIMFGLSRIDKFRQVEIQSFAKGQQVPDFILECQNAESVTFGRDCFVVTDPAGAKKLRVVWEHDTTLTPMIIVKQIEGIPIGWDWKIPFQGVDGGIGVQIQIVKATTETPNKEIIECPVIREGMKA